jgi:hypothetical protein
VGERETEIDQVLHSVMDWSMLVTDAGAVYAQDDRSVWFTDGGRPRQVAAHACVVAAGTHDDLGLATGNAGPLVAWFDCSTASRGDLVVYDTDAGHEVARRRIRPCVATREPSHLPSSRAACTPDAVVGQHVYFKRLPGSADQTQPLGHQFRFDVTSGHIEPAGQRVYLDDLRAQRRTLVIGDTWEGGTPTEAAGRGEWYLRPVGTRLVPMEVGGPRDDDVPTRAFTITGEPVGFRLPAGYQPPPSDAGSSFSVFEWLDDDTVALAQGGFSTVGDIVVCRLSDGRCRLAVRAAGIVPGLPLPG